MNTSSSSPPGPAPAPDLSESVAGEEDPGASLDIPPATPGTGEAPCPKCGGSGTLAGSSCPECQGTGKVTVGIGGA